MQRTTTIVGNNDVGATRVFGNEIRDEALPQDILLGDDFTTTPARGIAYLQECQG